MKKRNINWRLISDGAIIFGMLAILIGYTFLAVEIKQCKQRLDDLETFYEVYDNVNKQYEEIDPEIVVPDKLNKFFGGNK